MTRKDHTLAPRHKTWAEPSRGNWTFWLFGLGSLSWLLLRSGTNPRRLAYPCQRSALAGSLGLVQSAAEVFVGYLSSFVGSAHLYQRLKRMATLTAIGLPLLVLLLVPVLVGSNLPATPAHADPSGRAPSGRSLDLPGWTSPSAVSNVFAVTNVPVPECGLDGGTLPATPPCNDPSYALRDAGVDSLVSEMEARGDYFYRTTAHPAGIVGADDVVVIKINNQWGGQGDGSGYGRLSTNTDVLKGLIWRILQHPEGFSGEVVIAENTQDVLPNWNITPANAQDQNQSYQDVVDAFQSLGYAVSLFTWDDLGDNLISGGSVGGAGYPSGEYARGNYDDAYILREDPAGSGTNELSYPKFRTAGGHYVSMRYGVWNGSSYDADRLTFINVPVLKRHGMAGACLTDADRDGYVDVVDIETSAQDQDCIVYLPLIASHWQEPWSSVTPTPTPTPTTVTPAGLIHPSDLTYLGAFAYPPGDEWAYSGHALAYYPGGDPTGPADGYPGSLYAAAHTWNDLVGEIAIPAPVIADAFDDLPAASVLHSLTDITGGWKDNCTYNDDCIYREVDGLEYLPNVNKIAWNLRDWYNTAGYDQDSLGWSELDMSGAQGVWHIGDRPSDGNLFHNARTSNYLFKAPEDFAGRYLEGKWLIAGNHRQAGAFGGSQGPTLYALAPWEDGNPPASGQNLDALALLYYPEIYPGCLDNPDECYFPNYRPADDWGGGAWVQTASKSSILIFGRKGLGDNCYGTPEECGGDACDPYKGYHAYPYEPQILFYDPDKLREVVAGTREPWEVVPYAVFSPLDEVFGQGCAVLGAAAYDRERGLIYVTEKEAGPWGETAVHVWRVAE